MVRGRKKYCFCIDDSSFEKTSLDELKQILDKQGPDKFLEHIRKAKKKRSNAKNLNNSTN